jgi:hypothetical protein
VPSARRAARALLLRSTSALFLRDAHAPVVVQIAICESERMISPVSHSRPGINTRREAHYYNQTITETTIRCITNQIPVRGSVEKPDYIFTNKRITTHML